MPHLLDFRHTMWTIVLMLFLNTLLWAGAWPQEKGAYFLKLGVSYLNTGQEFNHLGERIHILEDYVVYDNTRFRDISVSSYFEYGLFRRVTVIGNLVYKASTSKRRENTSYLRRDVSITTGGFADFQIYSRILLLNKGLVLSLQPGIKVPLGYQRFPDNDGPSLGTADRDAEIQLLAGSSLYPLPLYLTAGVGYRSRGGVLHDEYFANFEAGYQWPRFLFRILVDGVQNTQTPPDLYGQTIVTPLPGGGGVTPVLQYGDQNYLKVSPSLFVKLIPGVQMQLEWIYLAAGKNIISGNTFSLGLVLQGK